MIKKTSILILFLYCILPGCKKIKLGRDFKNQQHDTVYPGAYFPVYPGSSWRYLNKNGDTITYSTSPAWQLHNFNYLKNNTIATTPLMYVPVWEGKYIYKYCRLINEYKTAFTDTTYTLYYTFPYVTETVGDSWSLKGGDPRMPGAGRSNRVTKKGVSIIIGSLIYNDVIEVTEFWRYPDAWVYSYYAKDIGLIKIDTVGNSTDVFELVDYTINK